PLNPVLLLASEHELAPDLPEQVRADFAAIRKNIALEARLIDDLLDLTRISRGKLQLQVEPIDIHAVLHQGLNLVRSELEAKQLVITLDLSSPEHRIIGDSARLQQVFWNIVLNAVKFTPAGGTVAVRTRPGAERSIHVEIADTGLGIDPEEMPRIFETFGQGQHAHTPHRFGGLGLGLAIARLLVERHEGRIWADSAGRGHGATFHIELPLADTPIDAEFAPAPLAPEPIICRRILLVEDHEPTRSTLLRLLRRHGHEVQGAETLATARALAATGEFELVISDLGLPDGTGHELMAGLRADHGLAGIALSGYGMEEDIQRSHECGFYAHLTKPVDMTALEAAIAQMPTAEAIPESTEEVPG
ncbi:MAG: response regulator, partial [Verrucomicrobiaceae bacterium]